MVLYLKSKKIKRPSFDYSSTQINFPTKIAQKIIKWGKEEISNDDIYTESSLERKFGRETEIHCTIKYGLHTNKVKDVKDKVSGFGSFNIKLGELSRFTPHDKPYDVIKIDVESDQLCLLNKILCDLPNSDEHDEYHPHVTIAYIKNGTNYNLSGKRPFIDTKVFVSDIVFSPKNGDPVLVSLY